MRLPPLLQNNRRARIAAIAAAGVILLLVLMLAFGNDEKPEHVIVPLPPETPAPPPPPEGASEIILQLFNPSDQSLTNQLSTTVFKQQIEEAMTVSFVLTKCRIITQDDYANTFRALIVYAQQTKLAADEATADTLVRQIAESAGASYSLVYSRTPCDDPKLPVLAQQLAQWVDQVFKR